jgi:hypothetical protein
MTMSTAELIDQLKHLSTVDRLAVIEAATRLIREELVSHKDAARQEQDRRMREAAMALRDLYEPGGELTEWTELDTKVSGGRPPPGA